MANLEQQNPEWADLTRIETTTPWVGGKLGTANMQAISLMKRTEYLKLRADEVDAAKEGMPSLLDRMNAIGSSPKALFRKGFVPDVPVAASTENVDVVSGTLLIIDGIQTEAGDLIFLKDQTDPIENGFWEAQTGAWNRYSGYENDETQVFTQKLIDIHYGEVNRGLVFVIEVDAYVIGTTPLQFVETYLSTKIQPGTALFRDRNGEVEDLTKLKTEVAGDSTKQFSILNSHAEVVRGVGRDLMKVFLGHGFEEMTSQALIDEAILETYYLLNRNMNNNDEIDGSRIPIVDNLRYGDFIKGISYEGIAAPAAGDAPGAWSDAYENNLVVLAAINPYKWVGDSGQGLEKNHVMFRHANCPMRLRMNASNTNAGGYPASEARVYLEGAAGNGSGIFATKLKEKIGDVLCTLRKYNSTKGGAAWNDFTVFLLNEVELFGRQTFGDELTTSYANTNIHIPLFQDGYEFLMPKWNGARQWNWTATPLAGSSTNFVFVSGNGHVNINNTASSVGGCAPAFCVGK